MKIYIIRHGETLWNVQRKLQGASNTELNEKGITYAQMTGEALKNIPFYCCFTSPLKRAVDTAKLVLGKREVPIYKDERIREIGFGIWEGQDSAKLPKEELEHFFQRPEKYVPPKEAETLEEIIERTRDFWLDITGRKELQDKTILIASHGCAVRAILQNVYENPSLNEFWHGKVPPNCAVNIVEVKEGKAFLLEEDMIYYLR